MNGILQNRIRPHTAPTTSSFSEVKVNDVNPKALDSTAGGETSFKDLIMNSNDEVVKARTAQKNGDELRMAKTDEEFARMMHDKLNKENLRKPQNNLDKDAFLKLFITQMQNQDPLNPDNSAEMAAQLAQFNGLEQMMNVNKNLEKMQTEAATSRAVSLVDFVGKEVKLDNGKLRLENGKVSSGFMTAESEVPKAKLEVRDSAGAVIATRDLGYLKKGDHPVEWNGLDDKGEKAAGGVYTFNVVAKDMNDQDLPVKVTSLVKVTGVDLKDTAGAFYTDLGKVRIAEIASVGTSGVFSKAESIVKPEAPKGSDGKAGEEAGGQEKRDQAAAGTQPTVEAAAAAAAVPASTQVPAATARPASEPAAESEAAASRLSQPPNVLTTAMEIPFAGG